MTPTIRHGIVTAMLAALPCLLYAAPAATPAERAAYARLPVCKLRPDGRGLAVEPCRTAPTKRPLPRRPVPRQDYPAPAPAPVPDPSPVSAAPAAPAGDTPATLFQLTPRTGQAMPPPATSATPPPSPYVNHAPGAFAVPPPGVSQPVPATCGPAGCRDAAGTQYNGPVLTSPSGRLCSSAAGVITCM
ncbi:hypothetical protein [Pseudoduganella chitinolytica]|uniref:Uncharacterized protein n=1 Tax=Pseudoduganella chitinolytica TaxID=34070 RepID=A0ABY8BIB4_9BURK|nr:hypothetical protein [Pseudoduganella chitinolytica]WEF35702.1 hypothetical protein PX653_13430 [Pseudoduganella chitinolytica]